MQEHLIHLRSLLHDYWPHLALALSVILALSVAIHAAMTKNDVRAAISWVGVIIMSPLLGPFLYLIAGINRVRRQSRLEHSADVFYGTSHLPDLPSPILVPWWARPSVLYRFWGTGLAAANYAMETMYGY